MDEFGRERLVSRRSTAYRQYKQQQRAKKLAGKSMMSADMRMQAEREEWMARQQEEMEDGGWFGVTRVTCHHACMLVLLFIACFLSHPPLSPRQVWMLALINIAKSMGLFDKSTSQRAVCAWVW